MKYLIFLLFLSCNAQVRVTEVLDGDSFITSSGERVRMYDIDAPEIAHRPGETSQPFGYQAKAVLTETILYKEVYLERMGTDKYGRTLANVRFKPQASTVNRMMVSRGYAWVSKKYSHNPELISDMDTARKYGWGLWSYPNPERPYLFRKSHKN